MDQSVASSKPVKVSHSLRPDVVERLKELAYWERVSESSIIEFLLGEFLSLGDNGALGTIVKESVASRRRQRLIIRPQTGGSSDLTKELSDARHTFAQAVEAWRLRTTLPNFNRVSVARLKLAAARAKVVDAGIAAEAESV